MPNNNEWKLTAYNQYSVWVMCAREGREERASERERDCKNSPTKNEEINSHKVFNLNNFLPVSMGSWTRLDGDRNKRLCSSALWLTSKMLSASKTKLRDGALWVVWDGPSESISGLRGKRGSETESRIWQASAADMLEAMTLESSSDVRRSTE